MPSGAICRSPLKSVRGESVDRVLALVDWLKARADSTGRVGVAGFCLGGSLAFLVACSGSVDVVAPNYGKVPHSDLLRNSCPVVASYGGLDRWLRREASRVADELGRNDIVHDVKLYPDVGQGFMNQATEHCWLTSITRPLLAVGYERDAAEDAWERIEEFFGRFL